MCDIKHPQTPHTIQPAEPTTQKELASKKKYNQIMFLLFSFAIRYEIPQAVSQVYTNIPSLILWRRKVINMETYTNPS